MNAAEIKTMVQAELDRHNEELAIRVVREPVLRDGQWQVLVEPRTTEPARRSNYYDLLGEVEDELSDRSGVSVFLTPAPEGWYEYKVGDAKIEVRQREESLYVSPKGSGSMFAVYDLNGRYESSNVAGGMNPSDAESLGATLNGWRSSFDEAISQYLEERRKVAA